MRLLLLSFYYQPDLSAGSFRATALVKALREQMPAGSHIDVITTMPNRYQSFSQQAAEVESEPGLEVRRIAIPAHSSDMLGQSRSFMTFAREVRKVVKHRDYDLVCATSSRLMTAWLSASIARRKRIPLYLDIRDLFVDTIYDVLSGPAAWPIKQVFSRVESWTMRRANRINAVSRGFEGYFRERYPQVPMAFFTNGIDDEFLNVPAAPPTTKTDGRAVVLYAGNLGEGQGLHHILPGMARALSDRVRFVVIGDGGRRRDLETAVAGLSNVELRKPVQRADLIGAYQAADVLFLHLGDYAAFEKVLPSKLFEYAALGKPVLAGVAGYAAQFVREEITNSAVFAPCDVEAGVAAFSSLQLRDEPRPEFIAKHSRSNIARAMARDILALVSPGR
ncbi:glycosyltransferase family 4 protein [Steroidobacter flavus]|uniref:Glycosyltransferase family 4 protein n=1 Tax=Steroidobacter flavus TaxID=1842136 RepID=A0ABV8T0E1_9GAMM